MLAAGLAEDRDDQEREWQVQTVARRRAEQPEAGMFGAGRQEPGVVQQLHAGKRAAGGVRRGGLFRPGRDADCHSVCDRWKLVEHNVQAIALTIEAMRGMERWGAKHMIKAMFTGFKALPEKGSGENPFEVLGLDAAREYMEQEITAAYKRKAKTEHPDAGGSEERWRRVREAHDLAMASAK